MPYKAWQFRNLYISLEKKSIAKNTDICAIMSYDFLHEICHDDAEGVCKI